VADVVVVGFYGAADVLAVAAAGLALLEDAGFDFSVNEVKKPLSRWAAAAGDTGV